MLKKPCPYHKGSVNHTLEQCEMLKKYYNRVAHRDEDNKTDAGDKGGDDEFPQWRMPSSSSEEQRRI